MLNSPCKETEQPHKKNLRQTDLGGIYTDIHPLPRRSVATPLMMGPLMDDKEW